MALMSEIRQKDNAAYPATDKPVLLFGGLLILLILVFILDLFLGSVSLRPGEVIRAIFNNSDETTRTILSEFRLPKAITALLAGIALSISGLQMPVAISCVGVGMTVRVGIRVGVIVGAVVAVET